MQLRHQGRDGRASTVSDGSLSCQTSGSAGGDQWHLDPPYEVYQVSCVSSRSEIERNGAPVFVLISFQNRMPDDDRRRPAR